MAEVHDFEAGDLGCGTGLPRAFAEHMHSITVGDILRATVKDAAAREDLPALARMLAATIGRISLEPGWGVGVCEANRRHGWTGARVLPKGWASERPPRRSTMFPLDGRRGGALGYDTVAGVVGETLTLNLARPRQEGSSSCVRRSS